MTDQSSFILSIAADPDDDTVRLAFADYCDENGEPERATYIRAAIASGVVGPATEGGEHPWLRVPCAACYGSGSIGGVHTSNRLLTCKTCDGTGDMGGLTWTRTAYGHEQQYPTTPIAERVEWQRGFPHAIHCRLGDVCEEQVVGSSLVHQELKWTPTPWAEAVVTHHPVSEFYVSEPFDDDYFAWRRGAIPEFLFEMIQNHDASTADAAHTAMARALSKLVRAQVKRSS